jgi:hypothetical protein
MTESYGNLILRKQSICKIVFMVDVHVLAREDGKSAQFQKIFHKFFSPYTFSVSFSYSMIIRETSRNNLGQIESVNIVAQSDEIYN